MAELKCIHGETVLVDEADLPLVKGYRWTVNGDGYVVTFYGPRHARKSIRMSRLILGFPRLDAEHKNRNTLDNRRENLRPATRRQNTGNRCKQSNGKTSVYKGVTWHRIGLGYWRARFHWRDENSRRHSKHLGLFGDEIEAARAYNTAAKAHFGDFALLNPV